MGSGMLPCWRVYTTTHHRPSCHVVICRSGHSAAVLSLSPFTQHLVLAVALLSRAWSYEDPTPAFEPIRGHIAFYPSPFACSVDGEPVQPQARPCACP